METKKDKRDFVVKSVMYRSYETMCRFINEEIGIENVISICNDYDGRDFRVFYKECIADFKDIEQKI